MPCCMLWREAASSCCHAERPNGRRRPWTGRAGLEEGGLHTIRPALSASLLWKALLP